MVNKKISIFDTYKVGAKIVKDNFGFFYISYCITLFSLFFVLLVALAIHYEFYFVNFFAMKSHYNVGIALTLYFLKIMLPTLLVIKFCFSLMSTGWTKLVLDLQDNKLIKYSYLFKFYGLAFRVFILEMTKLIFLLIGSLLFLFIIQEGWSNYLVRTNNLEQLSNTVPMLTHPITLFAILFMISIVIFVNQRLRFAKYFIIDKNQSIFQSLKSSWNITSGLVVKLSFYSMFSVLILFFGNILIPLIAFVFALYYQVDANIYRQIAK